MSGPKHHPPPDTLHRIVEVTWEDAWQSGFEEFTLDQLQEDEHGPIVQRSTGYVVKHDDVGIMLVGDQDEDGGLHRAMFIPAGMIVSVKTLGS
jgi:hypothetical protein